MTIYTIPRKDHQSLHIIEGSLLNYTLKNDEFHIIVKNVNYPDFPQEIPTPNYTDWVKIKFKQFSYLKFVYGYATKNQDKDTTLIDNRIFTIHFQLIEIQYLKIH